MVPAGSPPPESLRRRGARAPPPGPGPGHPPAEGAAAASCGAGLEHATSRSVQDTSRPNDTERIESFILISLPASRRADHSQGTRRDRSFSARAPTLARSLRLRLGYDPQIGLRRPPAGGVLLFRLLGAHRSGDDDVLALFPVGRCGHLVPGRGLA